MIGNATPPFGKSFSFLSYIYLARWMWNGAWEHSKGKEALLRFCLVEKAKNVGGKEPLWFLALESLYHQKLWCQASYLQTDVIQCNQTSWESRVYVDPALQTKKKLFLLKWDFSLGRERETKPNSTCTLSVGHHSLYPKMGTLLDAVLHVLWKQLVSKQHTYQTIHTETHRCA